MDASGRYFNEVSSVLKRILSEEKDAIASAGRFVAQAVEADRLVHVFGTGGHSIMGAMEIFYRAGGLANINPLAPAGLSVLDSHPNIERTPGFAEDVLRYYNVSSGDILIILNVNGINAITIDAATYGKQLGATVIGITSRQFASRVPPDSPSRHPSNANLHDLSDVVVDVHIPAGDALIKIKGIEQPVGAGSTYAVCFAANLVMIKAMELLVAKGIQPPVWTSANIEGGDEANQRLLQEYLPRVRHLYPLF